MYRVLSASKDNYITDKFINGTRCSGSNVGHAATMDLYKLYNETYVSLSASVSGVIEQSRGLIQFDLSPLSALTASGKLNTNHSSFQCILTMKDVYGGQSTPSNFTLRLIPLSKSWDEGRGLDVVAYRDLDASNFLTASISGGTPSLWNLGGAGVSGTLGGVGLDVCVSGNLGSGLVDLTVSQVFAVGNEDLSMDVTRLVSGTLNGAIPNCGWRLSFSDSEESDTITRFVKRLGTRHTLNRELRPRLVVKYNDQMLDDSGELEFNSPQNVFFYNKVNGSPTNFLSGSTSISGGDCAILRLVASKSVSFTTSSFSVSHNATISHLTRSIAVLTQSFSASQLLLGGVAQTGIYTASIDLNLASNIALSNFLSGSTQQSFRYELLSTDATYAYSNGYYLFKKPLAGSSNAPEINWILNVTNLKDTYVHQEIARLRVFVQDYNTDILPLRVPSKTQSIILRNLQWRILHAFSKKVIIPFDSVATLCSTDADGMYFDCYFGDLDPGEVYEFEFMATENNSVHYLIDRGFRFKVTT